MENDLNKYLGLRVRSLRENAQMTQEELANVCDVSWRIDFQPGTRLRDA